MMRWVLLAVIVVVLATAATVAVQYLPASGSTGDRPAFPVPLGTRAKDTGPKPKAVVEGDRTYKFGTLPQRVTGKHSWVVRNEGKGVLELTMISSTCSCTLAKFKNGEKAVVPPGEITEIDLEFETRENNGPYEKGAEIGTNDPEFPQFSLHVKGLVFPAVMTYPPGEVANLMSLSSDVEDHNYHMAVYSKDRPDMKLLGATSSKPELITVAWEPLPKSDCEELKVENGFKVSIDVKSGLPLGLFREEVVIKTDHPKQPELKLTVTGTMTGPIAVGSPGRLAMHEPPVNGKTGGQGEVFITVVANRETTFEVVKAPKGLKVEVGPRPGLKGRYRLSVIVPPGTLAQKIEDEIVLKTDHPKVDKVIVPVSIYIQNTD